MRLIRRAALTALAILAAAPATAMAGETWVPYEVILQQVRSAPLIRVIINPEAGDMEIKFRALNEWHAYYPRIEQAELQRLLRARHVPVLFVPRRAHVPATAHPTHHVRYILAGAAAAALLLGGLVVLLTRRRRPPPAPAPG